MLRKERFCYRFGDFQLDPFSRRLICSGKAVHVSPKPFDILLVLLEHHGHIVSKEGLLQAVWPDTFVAEATLAQHVHTLRKLLGCGAESDMYIETAARHGYRFCHRVEVQPSAEARAQEDGATDSGLRKTREYVGLVSRIFDDPDSLTVNSPEGDWLTMGAGVAGLLVVEHTLEENSEQATIAILSMRKATPIEREFYEQRRQRQQKQKNRPGNPNKS